MKIHIIGLLLMMVMLSGSLHIAAQPVLGDSGTPVSGTSDSCVQNDCQDVIYVGNQFVSGTVSSGTHSSEILLHSDGTVDGTSIVDYESNYVRLDIGFSAEAGADFSAIIEPCTDTPVDENPQGRIYFINDASLVGDVYTTAPGSDVIGTGLPSNPYATLKYVIENVSLSSGTTIYIDTGIYEDTFVDINIPDLRIKGAGSYNTIFDNNNTDNNEEDNTLSMGNLFMRIYADGLLLEGFTVREYNYLVLNFSAVGPQGKAISVKEAECIIFDDINITENVNDADGMFFSALMIHGGSINISNSSISSNASSTEGIEGGGIDIYNYGGTNANVSIYNTSISNNIRNDRIGAGIAISGEHDIYIDNSTLSGNVSRESGGAIYVTAGANLNINNSCISDNIVTNEYETFANGGGVYVGEAVKLNVYNTIFESNKAISDAPLQERRGGAICKGYHKEDLTTIKVELCKFEKNEAGDGQHIYMSEARLDVNETQFLPEINAIQNVVGSIVYIQNSGTPESGTANFINTNPPTSYATPSCASTDCIADAGFDGFICPGENAQIGAEPQAGLAYYWDPPIGLDNPNIANPIATPSQTITYTLYTTGCGGYISQDEVTVYVASSEDIIFPDKHTILCGSNNTLYVEGGESYEWTPATGLSCSDCPNPTVNITESTTYEIAVTDANGCVFEQSIVVTPAGNIDVTITSDDDDNIICPGQTVQLTVTGATDYIWSPPYGLSNPNIENPIVTTSTTTTYTVTGFQGDCEATSEITLIVAPEYAIHINYTIDGCEVSFEASDLGLDSYEWTINNEVVSNSPKFIYNFTTNGTYQVCLTVIGNCGEEITVCEMVIVTECVCSE